MELRRKGYAMESDVEENDPDKGDEQLIHYLELRHTERSCRCIQQKCTQPCCSSTERHMNEAQPAPRSCNSAGGWIANQLLVESRDIRSGNACFQMAVTRKR